eukprot:7613357-Ditylum_brightwellii.AAC.1
MLGKEAAMVLRQLSCELAMKWDCPILQATNYVKTTMSLSIVRATNRCWHGFLCAVGIDGHPKDPL